MNSIRIFDMQEFCNVLQLMMQKTGGGYVVNLKNNQGQTHEKLFQLNGTLTFKGHRTFAYYDTED